MSRSPTPPNNNDLTERLLRTSATTDSSTSRSLSGDESGGAGQEQDLKLTDKSKEQLLAWVQADWDINPNAKCPETTVKQKRLMAVFLFFAGMSSAICYPLGRETGNNLGKEYGSQSLLSYIFGFITLFVVLALALPPGLKKGKELGAPQPKERMDVTRKKTKTKITCDLVKWLPALFTAGSVNAANTLSYFEKMGGFFVLPAFFYPAVVNKPETENIAKVTGFSKLWNIFKRSCCKNDSEANHQALILKCDERLERLLQKLSTMDRAALETLNEGIKKDAKSLLEEFFKERGPQDASETIIHTKCNKVLSKGVHFLPMMLTLFVGVAQYTNYNGGVETFEGFFQWVGVSEAGIKNIAFQIAETVYGVGAYIYNSPLSMMACYNLLANIPKIPNNLRSIYQSDWKYSVIKLLAFMVSLGCGGAIGYANYDIAQRLDGGNGSFFDELVNYSTGVSSFALFSKAAYNFFTASLPDSSDDEGLRESIARYVQNLREILPELKEEHLNALSSYLVPSSQFDESVVVPS